MKKLSFVISLILCLSTTILAQKKTFIGYELGYKGDLYSITDNGNSLAIKPINGFSSDLVFGRELKKNLILETGLQYTYAWWGMRFNEFVGFGISNSVESFQIPLILNKRIPFYKDNLSITPSIGCRLALNASNVSLKPSALRTGSGRGSTKLPTDSLFYSYESYENLKKFFVLLPFGLSLDYRTKKDFEFSLSANYNLGLSKIARYDARYRINDLPEQTAEYQYKGSNIQLLLGMRYPISNIWHNKEQMLEKRKSRFGEIKEMADNKFYAGIEVGPAWTRQDNTHPKIDYKFSDHNVRLGSDIMVGINLGYRLKNNWFLETGLQYHNYRNQYLVFDDGYNWHFSGYKSGDNTILQIPVKAKYDFSFLNNRLHIIPYIGTSLLAHGKGLGKYDENLMVSKTIEDNELVVVDTTLSTAYWVGKSNLVLNVGLGFEYALAKNLIFTVYANNSFGFADLNCLHVTVRNEEIKKEGDLYYKGSNFNIACGFKVPFGKRD